MAHSANGREQIEQGLLFAYLLQLNRYALKKELITNDIYKKIETSIRVQYGIHNS